MTPTRTSHRFESSSDTSSPVTDWTPIAGWSVIAIIVFRLWEFIPEIPFSELALDVVGGAVQACMMIGLHVLIVLTRRSRKAGLGLESQHVKTGSRVTHAQKREKSQIERKPADNAEKWFRVAGNASPDHPIYSTGYIIGSLGFKAPLRIRLLPASGTVRSNHASEER